MRRGTAALIETFDGRLLVDQSDLLRAVLSGKPSRIQTVNLHHLAIARDDVDFANLIKSADAVTADGWPVAHSLKRMGVSANRVTGASLVTDLLDTADLRGHRLALLGSVDSAGERFRTLVTARGGHLAFAEHGSMHDWDSDDLVSRLNHERVSLLVVAVSPPFGDSIAQSILDAGFRGTAISVGGAIDMAVGITRRAPSWVASAGFEWFYRALQDPKRLFRRYLRDCLPVLAMDLIPIWAAGVAKAHSR